MNTRLSNKIAVAIGIIFVSLSPLVVQGQQSQPDVIIPKIQMDNVPLPDAIKNLARQAGFNYILDPHIPSGSDASTVSLTLENITAGDALDKILKSHDLVKIENPATSVTRIAPANLDIQPVGREQVGTSTNTATPVTTNAATPLVVMDEVPLDFAIENLGRQLQVKITFDDKAEQVVSGKTVSLRWENVTVKQAMVALLDNYDLVMAEDAAKGTAQVRIKEKAVKSDAKDK
jgi:hypothetical protein